MAVAVRLGHMEIEVVGREAELEAIELWLDAPRPSALLIEGEAGIGKTTLWRAGVARAKERGVLVLSCAPLGGGIGCRVRRSR